MEISYFDVYKSENAKNPIKSVQNICTQTFDTDNE